MQRNWIRRLAVLSIGAALGLVTAAFWVPPSSASVRAATDVGVLVQSSYSSVDGAAQATGRSDQRMSANSAESTGQVIGVDTAMMYQQILGLGGSLESSSIYNLMHVSTASRAAIVQALFGPSGDRFSLARLPFGCPDFCAEPFYTYDDMPTGTTDPQLDHFTINKDVAAGIISVAQQVRQVNPAVKFYASPWSPPAWMKDNDSITGGGSVRPRWYRALADYYVKAIRAYAAQGIPIYALTAQNEPTVVQNYPSTFWTWQQERDFVVVLGSTFRREGLTTKIWIQDDNLLRTNEFGTNILGDPTAAQYVDSVAFHDYEGDPQWTGDLSQVATLRAAHPGVGMQLTERSYYGTAGADRLVQDFRSWMSSWTYWLTFLDDQGQPNAGPLDARASVLPVIAPHGNLDDWSLTDQFYLYGQFSRYVQQDARRVDSDYGSPATVTDVAFVNPDGGVVMVVVNQNASAVPVTVRTPDGQFTDQVPPSAVTTYRWQGSTGSASDRRTWRASGSADGPEPAGAAIDYNTSTRYSTRHAQTPGDQLMVDMGNPQHVSRILLDQVQVDNGASADDWPRGYALYASMDGSSWGSPIATGVGTPRMTTIAFPTVTTRYLRVVLTASAANRWWSVGEVFAFPT